MLENEDAERGDVLEVHDVADETDEAPRRAVEGYRRVVLEVFKLAQHPGAIGVRFLQVGVATSNVAPDREHEHVAHAGVVLRQRRLRGKLGRVNLVHLVPLPINAVPGAVLGACESLQHPGPERTGVLDVRADLVLVLGGAFVEYHPRLVHGGVQHLLDRRRDARVWRSHASGGQHRLDRGVIVPHKQVRLERVRCGVVVSNRVPMGEKRLGRDHKAQPDLRLLSERVLRKHVPSRPARAELGEQPVNLLVCRPPSRRLHRPPSRRRSHSPTTLSAGGGSILGPRPLLPRGLGECGRDRARCRRRRRRRRCFLAGRRRAHVGERRLFPRPRGVSPCRRRRSRGRCGRARGQPWHPRDRADL